MATSPLSGLRKSSLYRIGPIERPVQLAVDHDFIDCLLRVTSGWSIAPWGDVEYPIGISIIHDDTDFVITSDYSAEPIRDTDAAAAMSTLILQLISACCLARTDLLVLHAGAAAIQDRLIVIPAVGKAGKSTLTSTLAAAGATVFADDAFPVSLDRLTGFALGVAPSPRRPWPVTFDKATCDFLNRHIGIANERFAYIALPSGNGAGALAPLSTERLIGAFVIPERIHAVGAFDGIQLLPASRAETMTQLIVQHLGKPPPAREIVEKIAALVGSVPCWRLRYHSADRAAKFLITNPPFTAQ